jgi:hypothetical protein
LDLKRDILVSKFAFEWVNLYRYNPAMAGGGGDPTAAGSRHSVGGGYLEALGRVSGPMVGAVP